MQSTVRQQLETFYLQRAKRLKNLELGDLLSSGPQILWASESEGSPDIVDGMIEKYLTRFEDSWNKLIQDAGVCLKALYLRRHITAPRFLYEKERAKAHNRMVREFVNRYCMVEGGVDWSKLLRFNSSKD